MAKHQRQWVEETIPRITFEELVKYLAIDFQPDDNARLPRTLWESYLRDLAKSHLNPIQKVKAIR